MQNFLDHKSIIIYTDKKDFFINLTKFLPGICPSFFYYTNGDKLNVPNMTQIDSLESIKSIDNAFVLLDIPICYDKQQRDAKEIVEYLNKFGLPCDYISHYYKKQQTSVRILKTLSIYNFVNPITQNEIHITESTGQLIEIVFNENCTKSSVRIEKKTFAEDSDLRINVFNQNNRIRIKNNIWIKKNSTITCYGNCELTIENGCLFSEQCNIVCGYPYTRIDGSTSLAIPKSFRITIGKHVKIDQNVTILANTSIGNGCIVQPYSVVCGDFNPCSLIGGNLAQTLQKNISWANEKYNGNIEESFYSIRDRFAFKYFENKIPVVVHGCCVLTNTLLYSKKCKIEAQFFQNPLHTMFFPPIKIVREQIKTREQSEFLMNNVFNEFNKMPVEVIANSTAKYLVVDFADIRWNFVEFTEPVNTRIILNNSPFLTLQSINEDNRFVFSKRHYTDIGLSEWESYVEKYIELAKKHFDVENIVLVRVPVAKYYIKNNEKIFFDKNDPELAFEGLLRKIEDMFINKIGNCKIVSLRGEPVANGLDDFGVTPLHLVKDVYIDLAKQLDSFVE